MLVPVRLIGQIPVRRRGFWAGWGGVITTTAFALVLVALLVGWVILWVSRPDTSIALLTLGTLGLVAVLAVLFTLLNRVRHSTHLRNAEAAFLTAVSHNLRTPIAGIRAAAQTLQRADLDPKVQVQLRAAIIAESDRLARTIDNILETGRLEVERRAFAAEPVDLRELAKEAMAHLKLVSDVSGVSLELAPGPPVRVLGDARSLRMLVDNLLDNALKYSDPPGAIRIRFGAEDGWTLLQVADQGIGFEAAEGDALFKRFRRGDGGRAGAGLGLALARSIARGHGGEVTLSSAGQGEGATAELWLPTYEPEPAPTPSSPPTPSDHPLPRPTTDQGPEHG